MSDQSEPLNLEHFMSRLECRESNETTGTPQKAEVKLYEPPKEEEYEDSLLISRKAFSRFEEEMLCGICMNVYTDPIELPCFHVYCLNCLRRQVTIQKKPDVMPRCAECNREFNMRTVFSTKTT